MHIKYLKYTKNILAKFFRYLLFYMKPYNIMISIYRPSIIDKFTLIKEHGKL